jgi:hypothetical protein
MQAPLGLEQAAHWPCCQCPLSGGCRLVTLVGNLQPRICNSLPTEFVAYGRMSAHTVLMHPARPNLLTTDTGDAGHWYA